MGQLFELAAVGDELVMDGKHAAFAPLGFRVRLRLAHSLGQAVIPGLVEVGRILKRVVIREQHVLSGAFPLQSLPDKG